LIDEATEVGDKRFRRKCAEAFRARLIRSDIILASHNAELCGDIATAARFSPVAR
jgi:capsular polysaccharide transport system ATP-binding protein